MTGLSKLQTERLRLVLRYSPQYCSRLYKKTKKYNVLYSRSQTGFRGIHQPAVIRAQSLKSTTIKYSPYTMYSYVSRIVYIPKISIYHKILTNLINISFTDLILSSSLTSCSFLIISYRMHFL